MASNYNYDNKEELSSGWQTYSNYVAGPTAPVFIPDTLEAKAPAKPRKPRQPSLKKDDRVETPKGTGSVFIIDRDGTICVEIDNDPGILHEFEKKEIKKIRAKAK